MVLMIALVLVSILAIAVVPASAAITANGAPDKALMLVANNGTKQEGTVIVEVSETLSAGDIVTFDVDNVDAGATLEVKVGSYTLSTADANAKTYWHYKLSVTASAITLEGSDDGLTYNAVSSEAVAVSDATMSFVFTDGEDKFAKKAFIDNISMPSGTVYDFNFVDDKAASSNGGNTDAEIELSAIYGGAISIAAKTGYSDAYINQEGFYVNFYDIYGGNTIKTVLVGYGKRVLTPAGYEVVDVEDAAKIAKVEGDLYVAVVESDNNLVGGAYVRLINATFVDGDYAGESFGVFAKGSVVNVVADAAPANATFHGWYAGEFDDVKDTPLSTETTYAYTVTGNTVLTVDYSLPTYDVYVNGEVVATEEVGDLANIVAENKPGYIFKGFYNNEEMTDLHTSDKSFNVLMDSDKYFYADYEAIIYSITVISSGSVYLPEAPEGEQYVAGVDCIYGEEVTIVADEAPEGSHFIGWYAGAIKVAEVPTYTFNVNSNMALSAKYEVNPVKITVVGGTIDGYTNESAEEGEYFVTVSLGDEITLIPDVKDGQTFKCWKIGDSTEEILYKNYNYVTESDITIEAIFTAAVDPNAPVMVRVNNGTIKSNNSTSISVQKGTQVTVVAKDPAENQTFLGWFNGNVELSKDKEYTFTVTGAVTLTAKFNTDSKPVTTGCATIGGPSSGNGNGGIFMILGVLAITALAVTFGRHGKKIVKHAPKALGIILCLAVLCGAVVIPEATANATGDYSEIVNEDEVYTLEYTDVDFTEYFYVDGFDLGDKVKVTMEVFINRLSKYENGWNKTQFKGLGGQVIDDALPVNTWTNLVYETRVVATDNGFAVALSGHADGYLLMDVKNVVVTDSKITANLLGGATLYMLPNDEDTSDEQMNSFVLVTASGKVIVMDGGTFKDYVYLRDFLHGLTNKVDAWFISHYHSDHIGALALILYNRDIQIDTLYYDFPEHEILWGEVVKPDQVVSGTFNFDFNNKDELVSIIGSYNGGNSGTVLNNFLTSKYTGKYGDGSGGEGALRSDKPSSLYLMFYDELQRNIALPEGDANKIIGNVVETKRGDVFTFDDVEFRVLNDVLRFAGNYGNNTTINWRINTAGIDMLFLGDSGIEVGERLLADKELIFDDDGDGTADSSVYDNLLGCTIVQAAHHGQNGTSKEFYTTVKGDVYIYCAPKELFYGIGNSGVGSATTQCVKEREWQRQMGTVSMTYWMDGLVTIK